MFHRFVSCIITVLIFLILDAIPGRSADMILSPDQKILKVFYTESDKTGWKASLKGKVLSISTRDEYPKDDLTITAQSKTKITVRLYDNKGVKIGDTLYVINDRNLIIAKIEVRMIHYSDTFGYLLVGYGYYRLVNTENRVVQRIEDENSQYAYIYKGRGDFYYAHGQVGEAIKFYKKSLETDRSYPEAHLALGNIYLSKGMFQFAFKEFQEAYGQYPRIRDNEDKYLLLKGLTETRFRQVYEAYEVPSHLRKKYIEDGISYAAEALKLYPESKEIHYYLGVFYYKREAPDDVKAKEIFLKLITLDPLNIDAYIALSHLYNKHRNKAKARFYAEQAIRIDPANPQAQKLMKLTE